MGPKLRHPPVGAPLKLLLKGVLVLIRAAQAIRKQSNLLVASLQGTVRGAPLKWCSKLGEGCVQTHIKQVNTCRKFANNDHRTQSPQRF
jgi:hypothetical protein